MFKAKRFMSYKKKQLTPDLTPLIDVVFLLLIFFMVATTFDQKSGIKIDLPKSSLNEVESINNNISILISKDFQITLKIDKSGKTFQENIAKESLISKLKNELNFSKDKNVFVVADRGINYGDIVELMSDIKEAGATSIALETKRKEKNEN